MTPQQKRMFRRAGKHFDGIRTAQGHRLFALAREVKTIRYGELIVHHAPRSV